ncbi:Rab GTPase-activating protein tbc-11 [Caenorhabditis elegans]|uniref:Isoform d of Rab GTPase-activating protein tbc-11 n=1 Tax=Caenorhabditis elegans TaxID=6239 RepID=H2KZZ6-4|nr:Rab GTPase-activating protein tbc-11 [Caenorhabditis elegans]VTW47567.1 Rab GTPase-activating protein tbc-11 [Caenorhabditis elegans]
MEDFKDFTEVTQFTNVQYLGCSQLVNNDNDNEMKALMKVLDEQKGAQTINVTLVVPHNISGTVKLIDAQGKVLSSFSLVNIRFCIRGESSTSQNNCFGISFTHKISVGEHNSSDILHQCHVFRTSKAETAAKALYSFSYAFSNKNVSSESNRLEFQFESILEVKENDGTVEKPSWKLCPQHNGVFKVRRDREKKIVVQLRQIDGFLLNIKKCFGMLLAAGRNLRHSDLQLLEMDRNATGTDSAVFVIEANWDPRVHMFEVLNTETPRDTRVFMTVAIDVIVSEISEPIRFSMEAMSRVFHEHERFYKTPQTVVSEEFTLVLEKSCDQSDPNDRKLTFISLESDSDRKRSKQNLGKSPSRMPTQLLHPTGDDESDSDCDEPLLSGSGKVSQECKEEHLEMWDQLIENWDQQSDRPQKISELVLDGIPDKLRGRVWQLLSNAIDQPDLVEKYHIFLSQPCPSEQVIMRDIHRTFPAHDYFKESQGKGQQSLYKISKVYSLYDEEVSYCQGLSFLAASLLLHMPEEQAFCTLVKIMFNYGLRDLFKLGFDNLHLRFFQLTALLKDYIPDLSHHLEHIGIETHMYASQWFLTLFTAKFPLQMVFFILDLFLSQGMNTIFHISLALLDDAKTDLLQLDFEGTLKYFRVSLPRKYRTEASTKCLIHKAVKFRLNHSKLEVYENEYKRIKELERENEDPVLRMEKEIGRHQANTLRLERENDDLAHELVTSKIELRRKLDVAEDQIETSANAIERLTRQNMDILEENKNLMREYEQIKEMYRRDVLRLEENGSRAEKLLAEYKKLFSERSKRAENEREHFEVQKKAIIARISDCDKCWPAVCEWEKNRSPVHSASTPTGPDLLTKLEEREDHIKNLEIDLAQTKLSLVEAECRNQDLTHQLMAQSESDGKKWFKKTITQLKEVGSSLKHHERSNSSVTP